MTQTKKVKYLGQLTVEVIENWATRFEKEDDGYRCPGCGSPIMQTTCYVSIHWKLFGSSCAGSGKVLRLNYPFCPKCDGEIDYVTACYHV